MSTSHDSSVSYLTGKYSAPISIDILSNLIDSEGQKEWEYFLLFVIGWTIHGSALRFASPCGCSPIIETFHIFGITSRWRHVDPGSASYGIHIS
jgi:hypothetical protein